MEARISLVHFSGAINTVKKIGSEWQLGNAKIISEDDKHKRIRFINSKGTKLDFLSYDWTSEYKGLLGHCFPGAELTSVAERTTQLTWGEEVLKFFIDNPKWIPSLIFLLKNLLLLQASLTLTLNT